MNGKRSALTAGALYFLSIFALAFVVGALRVTLLVPRIGATLAVLCEVPIILAASWKVAPYWMRRFRVVTTADRVIMGAAAFSLLMLAEAGLARAFGQSLGQWGASLLTVPGAIGLGGQLLFALIPLMSMVGRRP